jgi:hypothetical protein
MEITRYHIEKIILKGKELTNMFMFHYHNEFSDTDNFTIAMNKINSYLNENNSLPHTIRIAENITHLLYNKHNSYDDRGRYRWGYNKGPIIGSLKLYNVIYLYDEKDSIIGTIYMKEVVTNTLDILYDS